MSARCAMCNTDFEALHPCRLANQALDDWVEVAICLTCWGALERRHRARLRERERRLLNEWYPPQQQEAQR